QVGATPIRVLVASSEITPTNFRFGHAVSSNAPNALPKVTVTLVRPDGAELKTKGGCLGSRMRQKAISISNSFRKALGLPLIVDSPTHVFAPQMHNNQNDRIRILPFVGTPNTFVEAMENTSNVYVAHPHPHHHHGKHMGFRHRLANAPFVERLHVALIALGPWEGRAVAFVLGCGLGVLLRMFWVLVIVAFRVIKGPREDENKYTQILLVEEYTPEPAAVAPPTYTYSDEKANQDKVMQQNE
ncbi:hypothetical protein H0H87_008973, partial [Tephrocybe sp. NHM501043]